MHFALLILRNFGKFVCIKAFHADSDWTHAMRPYILSHPFPKNPRFPRGENLIPFLPYIPTPFRQWRKSLAEFPPFHFQFSIFHSLCRGLAYVDPIFVGEL